MTALRTLALLAAVLLGVYGLNRLLTRHLGATASQLGAARTYLARHGERYRLHDCTRSASDSSRILCRARMPAGRDIDLRIDFLPGGRVAGTCVVGSGGCPWNP